VVAAADTSHVERFDLHLCSSQRVVVSGPLFPLDAVSVRPVIAAQVGAVEVGVVAASVPPGTAVRHGTRPAPLVVVLVTCTELHAEVLRHRVIV